MAGNGGPPPPPPPDQVFRQPPAPPPMDQLTATRESVQALSAAAAQGDGRVPTPLSSHHTGTKPRKDPTIKPSTKKRVTRKTRPGSGLLVESEFESDAESNLEHQSLGLGVEGLDTASATNNIHYSPDLEFTIPCRYSDTGCQEVFTDLTLADIHARTYHGEAATQPRQHQVETLQHQLSRSSHQTQPAIP